MQAYDVIVIGTGGVGSATLATLARRGLRVLGIDRFDPPHDRGSSHGETRVIRQAYFEHPDYVPLLRIAYQLWRELEARSGNDLFFQCGLLEVGPSDGEVVPGVLRAASEHQLPVETLTANDVAKRWPALCVPDGLTAVFEPTAGYLLVEQCIAAMLVEAAEHGAELLPHCEVVSWQADAQGVEVQTQLGNYRAGALVVTAGAWSGSLLADLGVSLVPLRKGLFWYPAAGVPDATKLPVFLYELDGRIPYGFPSLDGRRLKIAEHSGGTPVVNLLDLPRSTEASEQPFVDRFLAQCLPSASGPPLQYGTCLYTMTTDGHFIVDHHPLHRNVAFAAGLSGHGFKFTPVLGEALANLVTNRQARLPIEFLSVGRFASKR